MDSDTKFGIIMSMITITAVLSVIGGLSLNIGYRGYIQFPKNQQETQCTVQDANAMKWAFTRFQAIWTVSYNDSESEKISKIFLMNYTTFTDAAEATMNQYKVGEVYKCYFDKKKPYDLLWTLDDRINQGRHHLIAAFICGILILIIWMIPTGYFCYKYCIKRMVNSRKAGFIQDIYE